MLLGFIAVYVLAQLGIGLAVARQVRSDEDYLVAGRRLGPALATASMLATWFGAETCVGAAGQVYTMGWGGVAADPFGYGLTLLLFGAFVARRLWSERITTIADLYRRHFSPGVERAVAALMIPGSVLWAAAQLRAFGAVVGASTDLIGPSEGLFVAAVVTVLYTSLGGLLADAYTDLLQGGVLILCLLVLGGAALFSTGGAAAAAPAAPAVEASLLGTVDAWAVPILGSLFAQELAARAAAARSGGLAQRSAISAGALYILVGTIPVGLGLLARSQLPGLSDPEAALPAMAGLHLGWVGQGLLSGALVSAILSTIDSALLAASGLLTHNLLPRSTSSEARLRSARLGVFALGGLAWWLAGAADSVHGLVEEASAFGSAGFVVAGFAVLLRWRASAVTAYATLIAGAVSYVVGAHLWGLDGPFVASLLCAFVVFAAGVGLERGLNRGGSAAAR